MDAFLSTVVSMPTVVFTVPLVLALLYWLLTFLGAADVELLDSATGSLEALEGVDGALEGIDGVIEGADGALDGAMEGVDAAADAADGAAEAGHAPSSLGPVLQALHIGRIPLTITLSVWLLVGWAVSYLGSVMLRGTEGATWIAGSAGVLVGAWVAGGVGASLLTTPLLPVFEFRAGRTRDSVVGATATVTTGRVDRSFGQAEVQVDGDHLLVQVRCDAESNGLQRGSEALVVSFDPRREAFVVESLTPRG